MIGFIIGLFVGGIMGIVIMSLMAAASREDDRMERSGRENRIAPHKREA